jgi:3-oxoacyl-[acyl-carrier-protein] synthase II
MTQRIGRRRAVITGIGVATALGQDVGAVWSAVLAGASGVSRLERVDTGGLPVHIGGEMRDFDPTEHIEPRDSRLMDRFAQLAVAAGLGALRDAGLAIAGDVEPDRVGVVIGSALGGQTSTLEQAVVLHRDGVRQLNPYYVPMMLANGACAHVAIRIGATGMTSAPVTACAAGADAVGHAYRSVRRGETDVVICGGAEAPLNRLALAAFAQLGVLAVGDEEPGTASRPFDLDRRGCVLAEGAAIVVLEELGHALARGAGIYAELAGYAATADAHHPTAPDPSGAGAALCMSLALRDAGLDPSAVDYVNAHAIGCRAGDAAEARAIRTAFGEHAGRLACSSTKSMTGHLLGASGALETAITALAVRHDVVPPTINRDRPDPECDLDCVPGQARPMTVRAALSNSLGFGGHNASLVLRKHGAGG